MVAIWGSYSPNLRWPTYKGRYKGTLILRFLEQSSLLKSCVIAMNARNHHKLSRRALQIIYKIEQTHTSQDQQSPMIWKHSLQPVKWRRWQKTPEAGWGKVGETKSHLLNNKLFEMCSRGTLLISPGGWCLFFFFFCKSTKSISISHKGFTFVRLRL